MARWKALSKTPKQVKGKIGEKLRDNLEQLGLSHELATIKLDVELDFGPKDLVHEEANKPELLALYKQMEFRSWIKELEGEGVEAAAITGGGVEGEAQDEIVRYPHPKRSNTGVFWNKSCWKSLLRIAPEQDESPSVLRQKAGITRRQKS